MIDTARLVVFAAASLLLALIPGPAVLFIVARSIQRGRIVGLFSAFGIGIGSILQVCLTALGISALLLASSLAYSGLRWLGAAYLIYLGVRALTGRGTPGSAGHGPLSPRPGITGHGRPAPAAGDAGRAKGDLDEGWRAFRSGVVVNLLNPKTALFFLSFLPQFVDPHRGPAWAQTLVLGAVFVGIAACTDSLYALVAGSVRDLLGMRSSVALLRRWVSGVIYLALGVAAAVTGGRASS